MFSFHEKQQPEAWQFYKKQMLPKIIFESFIEIFWKDILLDLCIQKMKFSIKDFLTKCNQIRMKQRGFGNIYRRNPYWKTSFFVQCHLYSCPSKNFRFLLTQPWNFSYWLVDWPLFYKFDLEADTVQKWSFSFKISSVNMKKSLTENFISCAVRGVFRGLCQTSMMDLFCRK